MSDQLASELVDVLSRSKIRERFTASSLAATTTQAVLESAIWVELGDIPQDCRDPKDDMILETARVAGADFIATEDNDLHDMIEYKGIRIVNSLELLRILRS